MLRGEAPFQLREDVMGAEAGERRASSRRRRATPTPICSPRSKPCAPRWRRRANQPAYVIFPDRTLIEMAKVKPRTLDEMSRIHGVGEAKLQKYGAAFLAVMKDHA